MRRGDLGAHAPASHPSRPAGDPRGLSFPVSKAETRREGQEGAFGQWSWPLDVHVPPGDEGLTVRWAWGAPGMGPDPLPLPAARLPGPHRSRTLASAALAPGRAWRAPHLRQRCGELLPLLLPESRDCRALVARVGVRPEAAQPLRRLSWAGGDHPCLPPHPNESKRHWETEAPLKDLGGAAFSQGLSPQPPQSRPPTQNPMRAHSRPRCPRETEAHVEPGPGELPPAGLLTPSIPKVPHPGYTRRPEPGSRGRPPQPWPSSSRVAGTQRAPQVAASLPAPAPLEPERRVPGLPNRGLSAFLLCPPPDPTARSFRAPSPGQGGPALWSRQACQHMI